MRLGRIIGGVGLAVAVIGGVLVFREPAARSADHLDSPATKADPTVDLNDLYTWMDGNNVILVLTSNFSATPTTKFSDSVQYVFHTSSGAGYGAVTSNYDIICTFAVDQKISCWYGTDGVVTGDASKETGLSSADGKVKVFAGPRADPFFFNLEGFKATVGAVEGFVASNPAACVSDLTYTNCVNASGCPQLTPTTAGALGAQLSHSADGGAPQDFFANLNGLAIVVSIDKGLVTKGGGVVAAWASSHKKP